MRVVVTVPWGQRLGGGEAMLHAILGGAADSGHELELVFFEDGPWPAELRDAGLRVELLPSGRLREGRRFAATIASLAAILRARRPDLVLNWAAKTQLYGAPAAVLAGLGDRVLWWQHTIPDGHWIDRWATLLPARAVGCYCQAAAGAQQRLRPSRRTFVVFPGAATPSPTSVPAPLQLPAGVPVVGIVGRLQPWKGQDRLLRAQALLRERGLELHLVIVGGDAYGLSPEYASSLEPLVEELGLTGAVTLTGQVPDPGPYVEQMDVLVNASDPEPFGIVLLEAMARGVAVVAVNSGGPAEFIEDGSTGVLARSGEPAALADALERLLGSPSLRVQVAARGRERFLEEFTDVALRERFFAELQALAGDAPALDARAAPAAGPSIRAEDSQPSSRCDVTIVANDIGDVGGMEGVLRELVLGLHRRGHHVTVIARTFDVSATARDGVEFHRVRGPGRPFLIAYPWFVLAGSLAVRRWRRGIVQSTGAIVLNRVDVIGVHYCHQVGPVQASRAGRLFGAHVRLARLLKRATERACFRANRAASFACVSDGVAEEVRHHYPELAGRVITIHNGVDADTFRPGRRAEEARALRAALQIPQQRLVAAFVGSEWERKGLGPVIEALALAGDWDLVVAGGGDRPSYEERARSLGVAERIRWLGVTRDVQLVYQLADAFLSPSSYEAFSLVILEAAASGLPILATPVSGARELIEDGGNGFRITQDPRGIAERLSQLAEDPQLRARLGAAARASALQFSWERMVARHEELYERLLAGRPESARG